MLFSALVLVASVFVVLTLSRRAEASIVESQIQIVSEKSKLINVGRRAALIDLEDHVSAMHRRYRIASRQDEMDVCIEVMSKIQRQLLSMEIANERSRQNKLRAEVSRSSERTATHRASETSRQGGTRRIQVPDDNRI